MIKNASVYQVEMPTSAEMLDFTTDFMSHKPDIGQVSTIGFTKHPVTGDVVSSFQGGYCLTVQTWEKKLDNSAINAQVDEYLAELEITRGGKATKKEKQQCKEDVIARLLPTILPTPKITFAYFNTLKQHLIVDSSSDKVCDSITSLLRKAIGSLKATTLYVDSSIGLTAQVVECLEDGNRVLIENEVFIKDSLELKGSNGESLKLKGVDLFDSYDEIVGQINEARMYVKSINLDYKESINFNYVDGKFKNINFIGFEVPDSGEEQDRDHDWLCETVYSVKLISQLTTVICDHFTVVE